MATDDGRSSLAQYRLIPAFRSRELVFACLCTTMLGGPALAQAKRQEGPCGVAECPNDDARQLNDAYLSEATSDSERAQMKATIRADTYNGVTDWGFAKREYFAWRAITKGSDQGAPQQTPDQQMSLMRQVLASLQGSLVDPYSAHYLLPFGFTPTVQTWKIWGVDTTGYFTCGVVNSRNRMGGYAGNTVFIGVVHPDGSVETTMDDPTTSGQRYGGNLLERTCEEKRQQGQLPPINQTVQRALQG